MAEDKKQSPEDLEVLRRMAHIGRLSAGIGHNIMTPLSLIMMNADLLSMKLKNKEKFTSQLDEIVHQASLISDIAETMMWKVKVEEQNDPCRIQLGDLVRQDLDFWMGDMFFKHKLTKDFNINPHTPTLYGVPHHFTSFIDEWVASIVERALPKNGGRLKVEVDVTGEDEIFILFEDDLPLPSNEHIAVLDSGCATHDSETLFPALTRLLKTHPARVDFSVLPEDGLQFRLTWSL